MDYPHERKVVVIAVASVREAHQILLASGLYDVWSDDSLIDKQSGVQIQLVPLTGKN